MNLQNKKGYLINLACAPTTCAAWVYPVSMTVPAVFFTSFPLNDPYDQDLLACSWSRTSRAYKGNTISIPKNHPTDPAREGKYCPA